mmetsp:Transcript_10447/g.16387  ORF Transcript_10447/g.16387 Transcript_10447/m.16387 type:complete len:267 (-) Transcript_10447:87-887(-)|eukprot:CAMPEP_0117042204 /NCGR_PEP_ID=MMETSP0472-20121206/29407_1 /TAXON_ID=693140 ORGANISM="Tiarina fusus, Strain LIS" /NCGR_SAMPLE_ID=MMETSP0472 /ASSEMBLY_ACC=CAM_ASM_000603 /LENGTH=266 /DNA_ID=CAMNT_0004753385 /DNA_START=44 /DNA_END=844 /DNA_ORIENTATION=-
MATNTPLAASDPTQEEPIQQSNMQRTRSKELVDDTHHQVIDEDPLLISQSLTYVTDDGSVLHSFQSAPFSFGFKARFVILEAIFVVLVVCAVPIGAHGTVVVVSVANLLAVAWFWYNLVRSVDVTSDGTLRFWIGNIEIDIPFDKIVSIRRIATANAPCSLFTSVWPYRGFLSNPTEGVAVVTTVPSTPFWLWPRSAGKPERSFCGIFMCPKLTVVFSPSTGGQGFIQDVETEMHNFTSGTGKRRKTAEVQGSTITARTNPDFLDV